jgi:Ice-binding-like/Bacterial Ig-like domain
MTSKTPFLTFGTAILLLSLAPACGDSTQPDAELTAPIVVSSDPADGAIGVPLNGSISVTFSEAMDPATLTAGAFQLSAGATVLPGTVIYADSTAVFWPAVHLISDTAITATITTAASSDAGVALATPHAWHFTVGTTVAPGRPVNLGTAGDFVILSKSGISTVPPAVITGNLGVSPAAASYITGFSLAANATNAFSTSPQVTGKIYAANYASPTPAKMTTAIGDMGIAFTDAAGRAPDVRELGAGSIGGMNLTPGVYKWGTGLLIPTSITLTGSSTAVWIFQVAQDLTLSSGTSIVLAGGALPQNVFWQVAGKVELGTTAHLEGIVLTHTSITLRTGASIKGRLLAQTAVSIDGSTIVQP